MTWEKLSIDLEMLGSEDSVTLTHVLQGLNGLLTPQDSPEWASRALNFMTYELMAQCEGLEESDRFERLNEFFFRQKGFQFFSNPQGDLSESQLLLRPVLESRVGTPLMIALLYLHLAAHLDLPAYLVGIKGAYIMKWVRSGHCTYVDLCQDGRILTEAQVMDLVLRGAEEGKSVEALNILPARRLLTRYLDQLIRIYEKSEQSLKLHLIYNVLLKVEPQNSKALGQRALLRRQLGLEKDALADLKRYFSFVDRSQAPAELLAIFQELTGRIDGVRTEFLH